MSEKDNIIPSTSLIQTIPYFSRANDLINEYEDEPIPVTNSNLGVVYAGDMRDDLKLQEAIMKDFGLHEQYLIENTDQYKEEELKRLNTPSSPSQEEIEQERGIYNENGWLPLEDEPEIKIESNIPNMQSGTYRLTSEDFKIKENKKVTDKEITDFKRKLLEE